MIKIVDGLKYTDTHEWLKIQANNIFVIGITDYAQDLLGEIVFVDLPKPGLHVLANQAILVLEAVKSAEDVYSPFIGEVIEINMALKDAPGRINQDPYGEGWLFKIQTVVTSEQIKFMDAKTYQQQIEKQV